MLARTDVATGNLVALPGNPSSVTLVVGDGTPFHVPTLGVAGTRLLAVPMLPDLDDPTSSANVDVLVGGQQVQSLRVSSPPSSGLPGDRVLELLDYLESAGAGLAPAASLDQATTFDSAIANLGQAVVRARAVVFEAQQQPVVLGTYSGTDLVLDASSLARLDSMIDGALAPIVSPGGPAGVQSQSLSVFALTVVCVLATGTSALWIPVAAAALAVDAYSMPGAGLGALVSSFVTSALQTSAPKSGADGDAQGSARSVGPYVAEALPLVQTAFAGGPLGVDATAARNDAEAALSSSGGTGGSGGSGGTGATSGAGGAGGTGGAGGAGGAGGTAGSSGCSGGCPTRYPRCTTTDDTGSPCCAECLTDGDCPANEPQHCDLSASTCGGFCRCQSDSDCPAGLPTCCPAGNCHVSPSYC